MFNLSRRISLTLSFGNCVDQVLSPYTQIQTIYYEFEDALFTKKVKKHKKYLMKTYDVYILIEIIKNVEHKCFIDK